MPPKPSLSQLRLIERVVRTLRPSQSAVQAFAGANQYPSLRQPIERAVSTPNSVIKIPDLQRRLSSSVYQKYEKKEKKQGSVSITEFSTPPAKYGRESKTQEAVREIVEDTVANKIYKPADENLGLEEAVIKGTEVPYVVKSWVPVNEGKFLDYCLESGAFFRATTKWVGAHPKTDSSAGERAVCIIPSSMTSDDRPLSIFVMDIGGENPDGELGDQVPHIHSFGDRVVFGVVGPTGGSVFLEDGTDSEGKPILKEFKYQPYERFCVFIPRGKVHCFGGVGIDGKPARMVAYSIHNADRRELEEAKEKEGALSDAIIEALTTVVKRSDLSTERRECDTSENLAYKKFFRDFQSVGEDETQTMYQKAALVHIVMACKNPDVDSKRLIEIARSLDITKDMLNSVGCTDEALHRGIQCLDTESPVATIVGSHQDSGGISDEKFSLVSDVMAGAPDFTITYCPVGTEADYAGIINMVRGFFPNDKEMNSASLFHTPQEDEGMSIHAIIGSESENDPYTMRDDPHLLQLYSDGSGVIEIAVENGKGSGEFRAIPIILPVGVTTLQVPSGMAYRLFDAGGLAMTNDDNLIARAQGVDMSMCSDLYGRSSYQVPADNVTTVLGASIDPQDVVLLIKANRHAAEKEKKSSSVFISGCLNTGSSWVTAYSAGVASFPGVGYSPITNVSKCFYRRGGEEPMAVPMEGEVDGNRCDRGLGGKGKV